MGAIKPKGLNRIAKIGQGHLYLREFSLLLLLCMLIYCRRADIKCVIIDGISKGGDYEVGLPEQDLDKMRDRWNAVYLDKNWRFVHPYWGSKGSANVSRISYHEHFFIFRKRTIIKLLKVSYVFFI